jgi:stage II sporulation protein D
VRFGPAVLAAVIACGAAGPAPVSRPAMATGGVRLAVPGGGRPVRIAIADGTAKSGKISATGAWVLLYSGGRKTLVRGTGKGTWTLERHSGGKLRVYSEGGETATRNGPLVARPLGDDAFVTWNGRRYRGALEIRAGDGGLLVINELPVEDYVRGVAPLELGEVSEREMAALEAQVIAARSYAYVRLDDPDNLRRPYDLVATVSDQVYGGVSAETRLGDAAVSETAGQVLAYGGRIVNAPYFAACGGSTAAQSEVWHAPDVPYLQSVSDQMPGQGDRWYCDGSSKFRWTRTFSRAELTAVLAKYLRHYAEAGPVWHEVGAVRGVGAESLTPSGRVGEIAITTDRATYRVRGNDIRSVFRAPNGEILNSTYFAIEQTIGPDGRVSALTLRGNGNGHGVGMCQAGAIGRARAGQDYRTILQTYYPGTVIATVG